jgi:hypothetical protein
MRFLFGIIVGAALTILTAYFVDSRTNLASTEPTATRQMVNWDVVSHNWHQFSDLVRGEWRRLTTS